MDKVHEDRVLVERVGAFRKPSSTGDDFLKGFYHIVFRRYSELKDVLWFQSFWN